MTGSRGWSVALPGLHRVRAKGRVYVYAWRGRGAPLIGRYESDAEMRADAAGLAERYALHARPKPQRNTVARLIVDFLESPTWAGYADSTKREWRRHLDRIGATFGDLTLDEIQRRGARALIKKWHAQQSETPRTANIALTVLTRLLAWGVDEEQLERNPAAGIARLDEGGSRAGIIWTNAELAAVIREGNAHLERALRLIRLTGLRREDAIQLRWSQVHPELGLIIRPTNKSGGRHKAHIPLTPDLAALLDACPRTAVTVLTSAQGTPYKSGGSFRSAFDSARRRAGLSGKGIHDLRGTRVTEAFAQGVSDGEAERLFGWAPGQGAKMRSIYADATTLAVLQAGKGALSINGKIG